MNHSGDDDLISVIVPAYNAGRFLEPAIRSALAQTHARLEILIVDDGSGDDTVAIARRLEESDPRVRLIQIPRSGVSTARNRAIAEAKGDFIAPLDADDLWLPEKLACQLAVFRAGPESVGLVYCWCSAVDGRGDIIMPSWSRGTAQGDVLHAVIVEGFVGNGSTPLIRKSAIEKIGGYDTAMPPCEDWKLYIELAGMSDFAFVPAYLSAYRFSEVHASTGTGWEEALARVTAWIEKTWPDLPPSVLRDRAFIVNHYLAFLAVRRGAYAAALRYHARALLLRPATFFSRRTSDFIGLLASHAIGWPQYSWQLFAKRQAFLKPVRRD